MARYKYYLNMTLPCYVEANSFEEAEKKIVNSDYDIEMSTPNIDVGDELEIFTYHFGGKIDGKPYP